MLCLALFGAREAGCFREVAALHSVLVSLYAKRYRLVGWGVWGGVGRTPP